MEIPGMPVEAIDTPALVIDLDKMEANIARMAQFFSGVEASLRPHTKTHKTPALAHKQIEAGAQGITCAKLGEAEVMAAAGIRDILVANQIIGRTKISRLVALARHADIIVAVDDVVNVRDISDAAQKSGSTVGMLIEVDVGMKRCGVPPGEPALELARVIERCPGVVFRGIMGYEGHIIGEPDDAVRYAECRNSMTMLTETADHIRQGGIPVDLVSGGGTGTYRVTGTFPGITEVQAGSYILMDATYHKRIPEFECAITVYASIVSRPGDELAIADAGLKAMTNEFGSPVIRDIAGATLMRQSEEHVKIQLEGASVALRPGDKIHILPSHVCTTINLHDRMYGVRDGRLETVWTVAARGKLQ
jgi:D-serine deaminase-like pyridoxal phosphate-dependent protein